VNCPTCLKVALPSCPPQIVVNGGLEVNSRYRWEITDKFENIYNGVTDTDATGLLQINIQDDVDIPKGLFNSFSGVFILKVYSFLSQFEVDPASFTVGDIVYDCVELKFKNYRPQSSYFDPNAPVYVPPFIEPIAFAFTDQFIVVVLHELGYRPFVQIEDELGNIIGGDVHHDSNDQFTVTFDSSTSGTIYYR
jgi:hypothetical protein